MWRRCVLEVVKNLSYLAEMLRWMVKSNKLPDYCLRLCFYYNILIGVVQYVSTKKIFFTPSYVQNDYVTEPEVRKNIM